MEQVVYFYMRRAMQELAAADGNELLWMSSDNLESKERFNVRSLLASGIDVLVFQPVDERIAGPSVEEVVARGIPVVALDRLPDDAPVAVYVTADSRRVGNLQAEILAKKLGGTGRIVILGGDESSQVAQEITAGNLEVLRRHPHLQVVLQRFHFRWSRTLAQFTVEEALETAGPIDGILANNSSEAMGAVDVLRRYGLSGKIPVVGADADLDACLAVLDGEMLADVDKRPFDLGAAAYRAAVRLVRGEGLDAGASITNGRYRVPVIYTSVELVTRENLVPVMSYRWSALALAE
ncbi:MAG: sugar ABC transporter substrate-binding protein [Acidobacteriota bacterium]